MWDRNKFGKGIESKSENLFVWIGKKTEKYEAFLRDDN